MLGAMLASLLVAAVGYADLSDGLVAYWSFNDPSNLAYDCLGPLQSATEAL